MPYVIAIITALLVLLVLLALWLERNLPIVTDTMILSDKISAPVTFCVIADLHNKCFGEGNRRLLSILSGISADAFLIPGDIITDGDSGNEPGIYFMMQLASLGKPVYFGLGNHEVRYALTHPEEYEKMLSEYRKAGITVLDNETAEGPGGTVISGVSIPLGCYRKFCETIPFTPSDMEELLPRDGKPGFRILLGHNPVYFETFRKWGADLSISGHMHGGLIRLPFIGAVISPQFRLFPKYSAGLFHEENAWLYVSRGLGTHTVNIRIHNRPEVAVIHINWKAGKEQA